MPKGPRNLKISFGSTTLTHYAGVYLLHRFLTRIGFKRALGQDLHLVQRNNRYSGGEMLLALLYPMILGLERIETTQLLRQNGVFGEQRGMAWADEAVQPTDTLESRPSHLPIAVARVCPWSRAARVCSRVERRCWKDARSALSSATSALSRLISSACLSICLACLCASFSSIGINS